MLCCVLCSCVVLCWVWLVLCMLLMLISHGTVGQTDRQLDKSTTIWSHSSQLDAISISIHEFSLSCLCLCRCNWRSLFLVVISLLLLLLLCTCEVFMRFNSHLPATLTNIISSFSLYARYIFKHILPKQNKSCHLLPIKDAEAKKKKSNNNNNNSDGWCHCATASALRRSLHVLVMTA